MGIVLNADTIIVKLGVSHYNLTYPQSDHVIGTCVEVIEIVEWTFAAQVRMLDAYACIYHFVQTLIRVRSNALKLCKTRLGSRPHVNALPYIPPEPGCLIPALRTSPNSTLYFILHRHELANAGQHASSHTVKPACQRLPQGAALPVHFFGQVHQVRSWPATYILPLTLDTLPF